MVRVRVQNFQSLVDVTVEIDGLTVITGPNNSGKTAIMRAIRGLFTNAPAGPLVRNGATHLEVSLHFSDGCEILWRKGWTKPFQKGGTVNEYFVNGVLLENVGRGVPPEVEALGIREIPAASEMIWPQIAPQFDGVLFLLNKSGAAVAEALSDVERVGKLTRALRLSEKDRREKTDELKIRKKDLQLVTEEVERYAGLASVADLIRGIDERPLLEGRANLDRVIALRARRTVAKEQVGFYQGFRDEVPSVPERARKLKEVLKVIRGFLSRRTALKRTVEGFQGFVPPDLPGSTVATLRESRATLNSLRLLNERYRRTSQEREAVRGFSEPTFDSQRVEKLRMALRDLRGLSKRRANAIREVSRFDGAIPVPPPRIALTEKEALGELRRLKERLLSARSAVELRRSEVAKAQAAQEKAEETLRELLGERGRCPVCSSIHSPQLVHGASP